jgi:hypothetical protein
VPAAGVVCTVVCGAVCATARASCGAGASCKGHSALQLSRDLDCQYKTALVLAHKLREAMGSEVHNPVRRSQCAVPDCMRMLTPAPAHVLDRAAPRI